MLRKIFIIGIICYSISVVRADDVEHVQNSLSQSVQHAQTQGKILSAKTYNNQHVIKVLTPDGHIKTIKSEVKQQPDQQVMDSRFMPQRAELTNRPVSDKKINDLSDEW